MALSNARNLCWVISSAARPLHASKAESIDFFHGVQEIIESSDGLYFGESECSVQVFSRGKLGRRFAIRLDKISAIAI